jgi:hypothetical protein
MDKKEYEPAGLVFFTKVGCLPFCLLGKPGQTLHQIFTAKPNDFPLAILTRWQR